MKTLVQLLEEATQINGISGHEDDVRAWFIQEMTPYTTDIKVDALGNVLAYGNKYDAHKPTILLEGHMDEVGFIVKQITANGSLVLHPVGGWFEQNLLSSRVTVTALDKKTYRGTIGSIPPHLLSETQRKALMTLSQMLVDLGFTSREEVLNAKIVPGCMVVLDGPFYQLSEHRYIAKAFDNRYSLAQMISLAAELKGRDLAYNVVFAASVQEEVGLRGAHVLAQQVNPTLAIVLDCSPANDMTGDSTALGQLGQGALIRVMDSNFIAHRGFIELYTALLEKNGIAHQYFISNGGTDAGAIHKSFNGVTTLTACISGRNLHSPSSVIDLRDVESVKAGLLALLDYFNQHSMDEIILSK